ncbi:MAG: TIGR02452 family protein [Scytonematopsis contorta HA4267-MV1]|jgi:uncharacterized protein (TIGR02452 family)|nr:TIGR02452 family protein [Scytonematopsis contorta HA4267-MV1]
MKRITIAKDTLKIIAAGYYLSPSGENVDITQELSSCIAETKSYLPDALSKLENEVLLSNPTFPNTEFEVRNETTLMGAERMARSQEFKKIAVLNFASAKNPGGGFLNGAQAQEESLARSSALYSSLLKCREHYDFHRSESSLLYSHRIIYSPACPVFRTDDGTLLEKPYLVDFITSPAPNAGQIRRQKLEDEKKIYQVLQERGSKLLSLAVIHNCDALVLGAWGCGVFRNDPSMVAQMFSDFLLPEGQFWGRFKSVLFSILDSSPEQKTFTEFHKRFLLV